MKQRTFKKAAAGVLSLALLAGSLSVGSDVFGNDIKASAATDPATLKEASITLAGDIELNFYFNVPEGLSEDAKVIMTGPAKYTGDTINTVTKSVSDCQSGDEYKATYKMYATHMLEDITFQIKDGDTVVDLQNSSGQDIENDKFVYSVKAYKKAYMANPPQDDRYTNMVKATYNYGVYSAIYFGRLSAVPTGDDAPYDLGNTIQTEGDMDFQQLGANLTPNSLALICDTATGVRFYFNNTNTDADDIRSFYLEDRDLYDMTPEEKAAAEANGGVLYREWMVTKKLGTEDLYYVDITYNNPARCKANVDIQVKNKNGQNCGHVRLSPLHAAQLAIKAGQAESTQRATPQDSINLGYAFYDYVIAATQYPRN